MGDKSEILHWDYFLTNYERDLLHLSLEDMMRKYPRVNKEQVESDLNEIKTNLE